jgi:two-component system sensor kinase
MFLSDPHILETTQLDINFLMRSVFAISAETQQNALLKKIMDVVIESSGAADGYLLLEEKNRLVVRAEGHKDKGRLSAIGLSFEEIEGISKEVIDNVCRTAEYVVLGNTDKESSFKDSRKLEEFQKSSVLCLPLSKGSKTLGFLYLGNRLSDRSFTPKEVRMTELLVMQAAICLENVRILDEAKTVEITIDQREAIIESRNLRNRLEALEEMQRATMNILEDFDDEKAKLADAQHAFMNILEDIDVERFKTEEAKVLLRTRLEALEQTQRATMNILEDFDDEKAKLSDAQHAFMNILEDIDVERAKTEEAKVLLESVNKELEAFSYSVSHDLQAPLRSISGFAEAINEDFSPILDENGKRCLRIIQDSSNKMMRLIEDLLSFSRLGRQQMTKTDIDMSRLVKEVYEELLSQTPKRNIRFIVKDCPHILGDEAMMRRVLVNLLANAIKFTRTRPEAIIEFGYIPESNLNTYYVKDNGVGFDMQYSNKLFGVFQRLHSTAEFEGTGVGLALVNRIITRHGGTVKAESEPDKGATFFFSLPKGV